MAHFAEIKNGLVTRVVKVADSDTVDDQGNESETVGIQFCTDLLGGDWKQTSYNTRYGYHYDEQGDIDSGTPLRINYASEGYVYDTTLDAFYPQQPYPSWTLDSVKGIWKPPTPLPEDGHYIWDEESLSWT